VRQSVVMRRLLVCAVVAVVAGGGGDGHDGSVFGYDAKAPLDVRVKNSWNDGDVTVRGITYASPRGGRVPALVMKPAGKGPFAGLIVQHGMPGSGADMAAVGESFARLGAVVVLIDAPFARRSGEPVRFDERDRREQIQLIVDLCRAVDLLRARDDVDPDRIGYLGVSYGGAMGGLLAGVEHRIAAFVLRVGDGGLVEHFGTRRDSGGSLPPLPTARRRRWLAAMRPIEPLRWVRRATASLLFQSGRHDDVVPPADARRYQAAAPEPKEVRWYDSGHFLPPEADCDAAAWLAHHIGTSPEHEACAATG
jgi:dienelactone hydrolase